MSAFSVAVLCPKTQMRRPQGGTWPGNGPRMSFKSMLLGVNDEEGLPDIVYFKGLKMQAQEAL